MKEVEFRAKNLKSGEWEYGYYLEMKYNDERHSYIKKFDGPSKEVDPKTLGQYTGYIDLQNQKIYEGDIVRVTNEDTYESWNSEVRRRGVIDVSGCDYDYTLIEWADDDLVTQVIGNKYDNPELINR